MTDEKNRSAAPRYAFGRLLRAIETAERHADPATRQRALAKVDAWRAVLEGMASGSLTIGSRTPVEQTPPWVTLEVAHGGFATGRYVAESALLEHEVERIEALPPDTPGRTARERLNLFFLSDDGQRELVERVVHRTYAVDVPEEGALATVAWLLHLGHETEALELVATLRPLMHRLRFYPRPLASPRSAGTLVHVATAGEVAARLWDTTLDPRVSAMNEALRVWNPLYDRLVALWLDTVEGDPPSLERSADGTLVRRDDGQPMVAGGWPCRRWPSDWSERRELWLADYRVAREEHALAGKHRHPKSNFAILREALERCPSDAQALSPRDVGRIRHSLAGTVARHGTPESETRVRLRATQAAAAARPMHGDIACVVAARLGRYPAAEPLSSLAAIEAPVEEGESERVEGGVPIPRRLLAKAERALEASLEELLERGVLGSSESLALVLPQVTAGVVAAGITDPASRELYAQVYAAFRRRRSLLLLHLEHQVQVDELPWVGALEPLRRGGVAIEDAAGDALRDVTRAALFSFPQTILPNRLVRELGALAEQARLDLPLVEEVAADIFMGTFTTKWGRAAELAARSLHGTLYARYYDLPEGWTASTPTKRWGKPIDERFAELCRARAAEAGSGGSGVAQNGAILEQSQILTTHDLAVLVEGLGLREEVADRAPDLARRALRWAVRRLVDRPPEYQSRLRAIKNAAYAWRQAIFFLSLADVGTQHRVIAEIDPSPVPADQRARFDLALNGLRRVAEGAHFDTLGQMPEGRRFLGWSRGGHWLLSS